MNAKILTLAAAAGLLCASFAYALPTMLVDDATPSMSGTMSGAPNDNIGSMSGNGMSGSANSMSGNGMSGAPNNTGNDPSSDAATPDTATGDNDY